MKLSYLLLVSGICVLILFLNSCSLTCTPKITPSYTSFEHCYNGLSIYEIDLGKDSSYSRNKHYEILSSARISIKDLNVEEYDVKKVFYDQTINDRYQWVCSKGDFRIKPMNSISSDTLCLDFIPGRSYLFDFHNPKFEYVIHVEPNGSFSSYRIEKNVNF